MEEDKADVVFISAAKVFEEPNRLQRWVSKVRSFRAPLTFAIAEVFSGGRLESADQASAMIGKEANGEKDGTRIWILNSKEFARFGRELALRSGRNDNEATYRNRARAEGHHIYQESISDIER